MTTEETNRLIAEFMGFTHHYKPNGKEFWAEDIDVYYHKKLKFDTSWNWLMPVVEKIENLDMGDAVITIELDNCNISYGIANNYHAACYSKIESTYAVVLQFIQWYNTQQK